MGAMARGVQGLPVRRESARGATRLSGLPGRFTSLRVVCDFVRLTPLRIAGTDSCQAAHFGYVLSGHQKVVMDDGSELDFGPGDVVAIPLDTMAGLSEMSRA